MKVSRSMAEQVDRPLPEAAREAWESSFLGELPPALAQRLLVHARLEDVESGQIVVGGMEHREDAKLLLVVAGLLRVLIRSPDGRQATVRYATHGEVLGVPVLLGERGPVGVAAISDSQVLRLSAERFRAIAQNEVELAWATACYLARSALVGHQMIAADIFLSVRARVARHLLDLADRGPEGLVVAASHQDVADAIGSVREVVSRAVRVLSEQALIRRSGRLIVLTDPAGLHRVSIGQEP